MDPKDSDWAISYRYLDKDGPFAWPTGEEELFLLIWLKNLTEIPWHQISSLVREDKEPFLKKCSGDGLSHIADLRIQELLGSEEKYDENDFTWVYEFSYCLRYGDPRRLWCLKSNSTLFPLWWDPTHAVSGSDYSIWINPKLPCKDECLHPNRIPN